MLLIWSHINIQITFNLPTTTVDDDVFLSVTQWKDGSVAATVVGCDVIAVGCAVVVGCEVDEVFCVVVEFRCAVVIMW